MQLITTSHAYEETSFSQTAHMWLPMFIQTFYTNNCMVSSNYHDSPDTAVLKVK